MSVYNDSQPFWALRCGENQGTSAHPITKSPIEKLKISLCTSAHYNTKPLLAVRAISRGLFKVAQGLAYFPTSNPGTARSGLSRQIAEGTSGAGV